jgi:TorA maturation chaperone TorD
MTTAEKKAKTERDLLAEFRQAVAHDIMTLAVLHNEELAVELASQLVSQQFPAGLQFQLISEKGKEAEKLLHDSIQLLDGTIDTSTLDELAADYASIYLTHSLRASPYESVWIDEEGLAMQEPMFQVREDYRRHGLAVRDWRKRSDDHLVFQLHFVSHLLETGAKLEEPADFLDEHLLRWLPDFATRVATRCSTPFYAGLCAFTASYMDEVRDALSVILGKTRPTAEEIEQRMKPVATVKLPEPKYAPGTAPSW